MQNDLVSEGYISIESAAEYCIVRECPSVLRTALVHKISSSHNIVLK